MPTKIQQLDRVARRIVDGASSNSQVDLSGLRAYFRTAVGQDHLVSGLADEVTQYSNYERTVRRADMSLFAEKLPTPVLYLAACPYATVQGTITAVTSGIKLITLEPNHGGLHIDVAQASPEQIAESRVQAAEASDRATKSEWLHELERQYKDAAALTLAGLNARLVHALSKRVELSDDRLLKESFTTKVEKSRGYVDLHDLALFAVKLNTDLVALLEDPID